MATLEGLQEQIETMKAFIGLDGYRSGQQRVRETYLAQLQQVVADAKLIMGDTEMDEEAREAMLDRMLSQMDVFKRRIDRLDRELGPRDGGNRAQRRRAKKPVPKN